MFDAMEAVDELIDDINNDYYESCYDAIYEELCDRVAYGELTLEEAEMINDAAAEKYLYTEKCSTPDEYESTLKQLSNQISKYKKYVEKATNKNDKDNLVQRINDLTRRYELTRKDYFRFKMDRELRSDPVGAGVPLERRSNGSQIRGSGLSKNRYKRR